MTRTRISASVGQQILSSSQNFFLPIAIESYFAAKAFEGMPDGTLHAYREKLMPFMAWCETQLITRMDQFTPEIIRSYFNLLAQDHNPGGVHGYYRVIHAFFTWWWYENEPDFHNPFDKAKMKKPKLAPLDPADNAVVRALLATCTKRTFFDVRDYAIISVLFDTGVRANELIMLDLADVGDRTLHVRYGKGRKSRHVHYGASVKRHLGRYIETRIDGDPCLFVSDYGGRLKYQGLRKIIYRRSLLANVRPPQLHSFRRAFAINCLLAGWDIYRLRDEMGLNSLTTLERYLKIVEVMRADLSRMTSPMDGLNADQRERTYSRRLS